MIKNPHSGILVQDGEVSGRALIYYNESTKIIPSCRTTIYRRMLEPTKKDKDKEEATAREQEGNIMIKSNPTTAGWVTHKWEGNNMKKVLPRLWFSQWSYMDVRVEL